ncbi:hypothetical protein BC828DRAFT_391131 [Blastocladiella britannica]|nr:hypothetical protein BC828DRAFT_391131 [Blastocladiella britannica]
MADQQQPPPSAASPIAADPVAPVLDAGANAAPPAGSDSQQQQPTIVDAPPPPAEVVAAALEPPTAPATAAPPAPIPLTKEQLKLQSKMQSMFSVFDKSKSGTCDIRETGTILRAMGVYPTEAKLKELILAMMDPAQPTTMTLAQFTRVAWPLICSKTMPRDDDDAIYRAFQVLDPESRGYVEVDQLKQALGSGGEPMSADELEEMVSSVAIKDGRFFYEEYLALME